MPEPGLIQNQCCFKWKIVGFPPVSEQFRICIRSISRLLSVRNTEIRREVSDIISFLLRSRPDGTAAGAVPNRMIQPDLAGRLKRFYRIIQLVKFPSVTVLFPDAVDPQLGDLSVQAVIPFSSSVI